MIIYSKLFTLHLAEFGSLTGGWVAGINDDNQYIEVNMEEPSKLTQIHMQGQEDEANWVTAFRVYFNNSDTGNWSLYQHESGEFVSYWNSSMHTSPRETHSGVIVFPFQGSTCTTLKGNLLALSNESNTIKTVLIELSSNFLSRFDIIQILVTTKFGFDRVKMFPVYQGYTGMGWNQKASFYFV